MDESDGVYNYYTEKSHSSLPLAIKETLRKGFIRASLKEMQSFNVCTCATTSLRYVIVGDQTASLPFPLCTFWGVVFQYIIEYVPYGFICHLNYRHNIYICIIYIVNTSS